MPSCRGPKDLHVRAISMFITAYAYTEYCLEGPEAAACAAKHAQALLLLLTTHQNYTEQNDVVCCYLDVGRDFIMRNTHLSGGLRSEGSPSRELMSAFDTLEKESCELIDLTACKPLLLLENTRSLLRSALTCKSPRDLVREGILQGYDHVFNMEAPGCITDEGGKQTCFHHELALPHGPQLRVDPALWSYSKEEPHVEMFHTLLGPLSSGGSEPFFVCAYRRHPRYQSQEGSIMVGFLELQPKADEWMDPILQQQGGRGGSLSGYSLVPVPASSDASPEPFPIAPGEDPRTLRHNGIIYIYSQVANEDTFAVRIVLIDAFSGAQMQLIPPEMTNSERTPHGKNWVPFSYNGRMHFIYMFEPLLIMRCDDLESSPRPSECHCTWLPAPEGATNIPAGEEGRTVGIFRGGSAGLTLMNQNGGADIVVGMGHITFSAYSHAPFFYRIDMATLRLDISILKPHRPISPSPGFSVFDPTSIFYVNGHFYVAATVRSHPDFQTFQQRHMETLVYKLQSELLPDLEEGVYVLV
ncbi:hypothetical protein CYMTET_6438 [Cymbomonas tetramitiformis]|uniref:Uncharacterized protein n=1 Tax=Cymbomonas tetramitiformis TaxID=36881 RepID=A0AAE0LI27_9CHLO|nr:hypothetical protein CYMTET_6438 [Cymbomonas tetramitiformis]